MSGVSAAEPSGLRVRPAVSKVGGAVPAAAGPVVFVHGSMDRSISFRRVVDYLPGRPIVGYDRRGWGRSRSMGGPNVSMATHVDDLCAVLAELDTPPVVVGHSYGALVALAAAARRPESTAGVVAFEPPVRWLPWWPATDPWEETVSRGAADGGPEQAARAMLTEILGRTGRLVLARAQPADLAADGASLLAEMADPTFSVPFFDPLDFHTPTVVAAGSLSVPHHREVARRLADLLPYGQFVEIQDARHGAHVSHPQEFAHLIDKLEQTPPDRV
ncbi:alpha/beta hydrolase [Streptomyces sp. NBC_00885]|uniref:alpha/beta fold hydrolase n=1 Tax=Streptomyces sp. NBC_00885 TaxID=2975857 RepID=UPI003865DD1B|nr:alpha/beta hydrolase [Streptomyces sp. NBC_00885]